MVGAGISRWNADRTGLESHADVSKQARNDEIDVPKEPIKHACMLYELTYEPILF